MILICLARAAFRGLYGTSISANNRVSSLDVTAAILVSQNKKTAAMLVFQTNTVGVELFSYANALLFQ